MSETGQADDLSRVVKILYRYALDPGGWVDLIDAMREIGPGPEGERLLADLDEHLDIAAALAVTEAPQVHETFASLELSPSLRVLSLSPTAAEAFAATLGNVAVGDRLDAERSDAAAAIANGIGVLKSSGSEKYPIVVPHGGKVSCSYLVRQAGAEDRYALFLMRNGFAEEYDLSATVLSELTEKEREVCGLLFEGQTPQQIADGAGVSLNTVKYHLKSVFAKTGINRQADLVRMLEQAYQLERELDRRLEGRSQLIIDQPRHVTLGAEVHPPKQTLTREGRTVAWRDYGPTEGRPVLWVPGLYACGRLWDDAVQAAAARGLRLIAIDRPGYGGTSLLPTPDIRGATADALAVLDHMNIDRLDVFGVAAGSLMALDLAHALPARVDRVFLCSAHFGPKGDWSKPGNRMGFALWFAQKNPRVIHAMMKLFVRPRTKEAQMEQIRRVWSESPADAEALRDDRLVEHMIAIGEEAVGHGIEGVVADIIALRDADVPLTEISQPVVEWHGFDDASTTSWDAAGKLLAPLPDLTRIPMPHRGQLVFHTDFHHMAERIAAAQGEPTRSGGGGRAGTP